MMCQDMHSAPNEGISPERNSICSIDRFTLVWQKKVGQPVSYRRSFRGPIGKTDHENAKVQITKHGFVISYFHSSVIEGAF